MAALQFDEALIDTYEIEKGPQFAYVELTGMTKTGQFIFPCTDGLKDNGKYGKYRCRCLRFYAKDSK